MKSPTRPCLLVLLCGLLLGQVCLGQNTVGQGVLDRNPLEPASSGGLASLDRALSRLSTHKRLLVIAAHPDDEDTLLLTYVARGLGGEAAYLSLSRGDAGQNLIGPELGVGLGLLRSRELLEARGIDGARQFFSRAYDFGYTRSLDETLELWPKSVLMEDAVRIIRRFKPQVLVAVFPPTSRAGHGQHWASAVVATEAFELAGDPASFPNLEDEGLAPWTPHAFYQSAFIDRASATLELPLGALEPFTGRSIFQISLASRSQHRCQDMGLELPLGDARGGVAWRRGGGGAEGKDLFAGIDTQPEAMAETLPDAMGDLKHSVALRLQRMGDLADNARRKLNAVNSQATTNSLLEIVQLLQSVEGDLANAGPDAGPVRHLVVEKLEIAEEALATAAGVLADAYTDREIVVPGTNFPVRSVFWNAGRRSVSTPRLSVVSAEGWEAKDVTSPEPSRSFFSAQATDEKVITVSVPADSPATVPYFLRRPRRGALYDWSGVAPEHRGQPFEAPPVAVQFTFEIEGVTVAIHREAVYRYRDQAAGEVRRPLRAMPKLEVSVEPGLVVWPIGDRDEEHLRVAIQSNSDAPVSAHLEVQVPPGWPPVTAPAIEIKDPRGRWVVDLVLRAPEQVTPGRYELHIAAVTGDGQRFSRSYPLIDYPHIRPTPMPQEARVTISAAEIRFPRRGRLGYIRGASDRVPELLKAVGMPIELMSASDLADGDLSIYDAVIIGSRAYETDANLVHFNRRLLDYAAAGGLVVVQYQQYQYSRGNFAPYSIEIHRPHGRVTDETADVRMLDPDHPVFTTPNKINGADWQGWVQERGLYFGGTWAEEYQPLLSMTDPGQSEMQGALLVARHGKGYYVYTGLSFFRQMPAGVPGAYRLFGNLLSLGQEP